MNKELPNQISKIKTWFTIGVDKDYSICQNIRRAVGYDNSTFFLEMLMKVAKKWPKYSGDWIYPVPNTNPNMTPHAQFHSTSNKWNPKGLYCRNRIELAELFLNYLQSYENSWRVRFLYRFGIIRIPKGGCPEWLKIQL